MIDMIDCEFLPGLHPFNKQRVLKSNDNTTLISGVKSNPVTFFGGWGIYATDGVWGIGK